MTARTDSDQARPDDRSGLDALGVRIIDDFYDDPDAVRAHALTLTYKPPAPPGRPGGVAHRFRCTEQRIAELDALLGRRLDRRVRINVANFRYTTQDTKKRVVCHTDVGLGDATAVIYLTENQLCRGGTAFFQHAPTGDTHADKARMSQYQARDETQWSEIHRATMRYNRCVVFPAAIFHSVIPLYFGRTPADSRLTQVAWFNYGQRRSRYAEAGLGQS